MRVDTVVVSTQHGAAVSQERIAEDMKKYVIGAVIPAYLLDENTRYLINPTGKFVIGGPEGDSGLTGRKIVVDYSGTVCYTSKDYDVLQASMKREHVTADSILIFSENGYEKTLTEGTVQILVHSVDENS